MGEVVKLLKRGNHRIAVTGRLPIHIQVGLAILAHDRVEILDIPFRRPDNWQRSRIDSPCAQVLPVAVSVISICWLISPICCQLSGLSVDR